MNRAFGARRYSAGYQWRKINNKPVTNPSIYNDNLVARCAGVIVAELRPLHEMEPISDTAQVAKNLRPNRPWT